MLLFFSSSSSSSFFFFFFFFFFFLRMRGYILYFSRIVQSYGCISDISSHRLNYSRKQKSFFQSDHVLVSFPFFIDSDISMFVSQIVCILITSVIMQQVLKTLALSPIVPHTWDSVYHVVCLPSGLFLSPNLNQSVSLSLTFPPLSFFTFSHTCIFNYQDVFSPFSFNLVSSFLFTPPQNRGGVIFSLQFVSLSICLCVRCFLVNKIPA